MRGATYGSVWQMGSGVRLTVMFVRCWQNMAHVLILHSSAMPRFVGEMAYYPLGGGWVQVE